MRPGEHWIDAALDELPEAPTELEALVWAAREHGDKIAGRMADELARTQEWEAVAS
jgi:hypothetical protein